MYGVILAGGGGTRLWPLSRAGLPKPLMPLLADGSTMLQATYARLRPLIDQYYHGANCGALLLRARGVTGRVEHRVAAVGRTGVRRVVREHGARRGRSVGHVMLTAS